MKKISVIVPVYNAEKYLHKCVDSLLRQDYPNFEIILIDDGSTDYSGRICDEYSNKEKSVFTLHQENKGVSAARNLGLSTATGEYLTFVDADDWVTENYLSAMEKQMQANGAVVGRYMYVENLETSVSITPPLCRKGCNQEESVKCLKKNEAQLSAIKTGKETIHIGMACKMFDRILLKRCGITFREDIQIGEDAIFFMQYLSNVTKTVKWIQNVLYYYRKSPEGAMSNKYKEGKMSLAGSRIYLESIEKTLDFSFSDGMSKYWKAVVIQSRENDLIFMVIRKMISEQQYKEYLQYVRKNMSFYLREKLGQTKSMKLGVLFCAIDPRIDYLIRKIAEKL